MRLWSLHPKYLDPQGLVALWREGLLARAVLHGETRGYRSHPQLDRFRAQASARLAIVAYLSAVCVEATARGYSFDRSKIGDAKRHKAIAVTQGQMQYEWEHLMRKLSVRNPPLHERWAPIASPDCHPLFRVVPGDMEPWERAVVK